jgi:hypothetical protein
VCCLESDEFYVLIIIFACKIVTLCSVDILYFLNLITENILVTKSGWWSALFWMMEGG